MCIRDRPPAPDPAADLPEAAAPPALVRGDSEADMLRLLADRLGARPVD
jgi:hypothetical protein